MEKIIIAGGTGFLGNVLIEYFKNKTEQIIVLTRGEEKQIDNISFCYWDSQTLGSWVKLLENANVLINMCGKSVDCRYTPANKKTIIESRTRTTALLGKALLQCNHPPKLWMNSSTATIYQHSLHTPMNEDTGILGNSFSENVAKAWEQTFFEHTIPNCRQVALRTSIVLGKKGGAFPTLYKLTKMGLGGQQGNGKQKVSWIHESDFARAVDFIIQKNDIHGAINIVAPSPVNNKLFMKKIRKIANVLIGIPQPKYLLEMGAFILQTETELILKSRNVIPSKLMQQGFHFRYGDLDIALENLINY